MDTKVKVILGVSALGVGVIGSGLLLAGCGNRGGGGGRVPSDGPMSELTKSLMNQLKPNSATRDQRLDVTRDAVRHVTNDAGAPTGAFDGTRLLRAADTHAYGTPAITNPAIDVKGDGSATFNEIRHVVRHFDADSSDSLDFAEIRSFEAEAGVRWIPARAS